MADRYDTLNHNTLMASVGSMSRRWSEGMYVAPPQKIEDFYTVPGPDGLVIADEMGAAIHQVTILNIAIRSTSYIEPEPLDDAVPDAIADRLSGSRPASASAAIGQITSINNEVYKRLTDLRMADWSKEAPWGSMTISITDLAKGISRVNAERLARATKTLAAVS